MTNAEYYLKDGVTIDIFINELKHIKQVMGWKGEPTIFICYIKDWLKEEAKPTLTEDERAILKNIKGYTTIIRNAENNIQVENEDGSFACLCAFNHLFQFIKLGEKYEIKELIKDDQH